MGQRRVEIRAADEEGTNTNHDFRGQHIEGDSGSGRIKAGFLQFREGQITQHKHWSV